MKKILFGFIFSVNLLTAQNWFPLGIGNKWQMFGSSEFQGSTYWWIKNFVINSDTIINGLKYYHHTAGIFRYDTVGQKLFTYGFNADSNKYAEGLYMDFNLPNNSTFRQFNPGSSIYNHREVTVVETNTTFLGRSWNVKGFKYYNYPYFGSGYWALNFGYFDSTPIQAQFWLNDSLLTYDHGYYPVIYFTPITQISSNRFKTNFSVHHYYSRWIPAGAPGGSLNYIESVNLLGFYEKGDSVYNIQPVSATIGQVCTLNFYLDLELLKRQYIFKYKIQAKDKGLILHYSTSPNTGYFSLVYVDSTTNITDNDNRPNNFALVQNYPNPFNPSTKIRYAIPLLGGARGGLVTIKIFDVLGNEIETLVNEEKSPGTYEITWNAVGLPSGVYFYQLRSGEFVETKKMLLLR